MQAFYVSDLFVRPRLWDIAKKIDDLQMYKTDSKRREGYGATDAPSNELQQVRGLNAHPPKYALINCMKTNDKILCNYYLCFI